MPDDTLYTCLIEERSNDEPFVQFYWARGDHMGTAIEKTLAAARENGLKLPKAMEADPFDIDSLEAEVYPNPEADVFFDTTQHFFPPEDSFDFPAGIIPSCIADEEAHEVDDLHEGYRRTRNEEGFIEIGVNVPGSNLLPLYSRLLSLHETCETFWYLIHDHWDGGENQFYENPGLNTASAIIGHLQQHPHDSVLNGFVTLTAYIAEGSTNFSISDQNGA